MVDPERGCVAVNPISADTETERDLGNCEEFRFPRHFICESLSSCGRAVWRGIGWIRGVCG